MFTDAQGLVRLRRTYGVQRWIGSEVQRFDWEQEDQGVLDRTGITRN